MVTPFVGRERDLASITEVVTRSLQAASPAAVIVTGDPGSGKSRLLAEACTAIGIGRRLNVVGYEPERHVPLAAARDLLAALASAGHEGRRLATLVYEARPGGLEPLRVFEGAHRSMADLGPVVLAIDDLQWVDELTSALCHYLVRAAQSTGNQLALLAASRPGQGVTSFGQSVRGLIQAPELFLEMVLGPLDRHTGVHLAMTLDPRLDEETATTLWEKAGGLPFWLEALVRAHDEEGEVGALLSARLAGTSADAASMLALMTVAGRPMQLSVLAELLEWPETRAKSAAEELVNRGIALRTGLAVRSAHDLVREAASKEMPSSLRRRNHEAMALWLEAEAGDDLQLLLEALDHRRSAGLPCLDVALRVVSSRRRRLLTGDDLRKLIDVADEEEAAGREPTPLLWEIASVAIEIADPALALERWADLMSRVGSPNQKARAALSASQAAMRLGDWGQADDFLSHSRSIAFNDPVLAVEIDAHESELANNSKGQALVPMRRSVEAARTMVDEAGGVERLTPEARRAYRSALQANLYYALRTERPLEMLRLAGEMSEAAFDSTASRLSSELDAALALRILGRYAEAERHCRTVWLEARRQVLPAVAFQSAHMLAGSLHHLGRLEEAKAVATEVVEIIERARGVIPTWLSSAWIKSLPHEIDISMGDWKKAIASIEQLVAEEEVAHFRLNIRLILGHWLARLAGTSAAKKVVSMLEDGAADAHAAGCTRCEAEFTVRAAQAYARVAHASAARGYLGAWDEHHPDPVGQFALWRRHAEALLVAADDAPEGAELLNGVIEVATSMEARLDETWAWLDLGAALTHFHKAGAVDALRRAQESARTLGAVSEAQKAEQGLRALGVRTWRRAAATGTPSRLTDRELEIARLVMHGASNPEVAEAVFLSRKTIERHVSNIMAKLGARNRTELASKLVQLTD